MTDYNVGDTVSITADASGRKPQWLEFTGSSTLEGAAALPSGHRRIKTVSGTTVSTHDINVLPVDLPDTDAPWRCAVYRPDGHYCVMDGLTGVPAIGTPAVRLQTDGPAKAQVTLPLVTSSGCPTDTTFDAWDDGSAAGIRRGMEMTVEYRDAESGVLVLVFRGIIYQVDKAENITLTAYDRLMDLATYSEQYQSIQGHINNRKSAQRTINGTTYTYNMYTDISAVDGCNFMNLLQIGPIHGSSVSGSAAIAHPMPIAGGIQAGGTIKKLAVEVTGGFTFDDPENTIHAQFYWFVNQGARLAPMGRSAEVTYSESKHSVGALLEADVNWSSIPSNAYIGVRAWATSYGDNARVCYLPGSSTHYTTDPSKYWTPSSDNVWHTWDTQYSGTYLPEISVAFEHESDAVDPALLTVGGSAVSIESSNIPYPTADHLTLVDPGVAIILDFYPVTAVALTDVVDDLIKCAGLTSDISGQVDGYTSYYTTSTYDYLTCINELIRASHCMATAGTDEAGIVHILPRHTLDEMPARSYTTDPAGAGTQAIVSHSLTAHWMAEKATVAYLAEDTTTSGLPVALETDDALMDNSLTELLGTPLRQVIADRSQGTHALQANTAGGKMVQLHTNVAEGSVVLAGYRTALWEYGTSYAGGVPVGLNVPEASVNSTAIPTQIVLHDGVTEVALDNIRTADRSEVANSMGLTADAISNGEGQLPKTVYLFVRTINYAERTGYTQGTLTSVGLVRSGASTVTQTNSVYLKTTTDAAGYIHYCAVFPANMNGYAPSNDIVAIQVTAGGTTWISVLENPRRALSNQAVHVDVRVRKA